MMHLLAQPSGSRCFYVQLMGAFTVTRLDGTRIAISSKKMQLLIAILVFHRGENIERRELARMVWSRHAEGNALTSLRQALTKLRVQLGDRFDQFIVSDRRHIKINAAFVTSDVAELLGLESINDENQELLFSSWDRFFINSAAAEDPRLRDWMTGVRCELFAHTEKLLRERIGSLEKTGREREYIKLVIREKDRIGNILRDEKLSRITGYPVANTSGGTPDTNPPDVQSLQHQTKYKMYLRNKVDLFWIKSVLDSHGEEVALMDLDLLPDQALIRNPCDAGAVGNPVVPLVRKAARIKSKEILHYYEQSLGKILVVGEPGSGKTTLLLRLVKDLLRRKGGPADDRVPVIFNAAGWSKNRGELVDWLTAELDYRYDVPVDIGRELVCKNHLAIFIDGLDEVNDAYAKQLVNAINEFSRMQPTIPLSVFCQNNWYESLSEKICAFGAFEIQPVNKDVYMEFVRTQKKNPELYLRHQPFTETQGEFLTSPLAVHMALSVADAKDVQITDESLVGQYARHLVKKGFAGSRFKDLAFGYLHHLADMMIASGRSIFYMDDFVDTSLYDKPMQFLVHLIPIALITALCVVLVSAMAYQHSPELKSIYIPLLHGVVGIAVIMFLGDSGDAKLLPRYHYSLLAFRKNMVVRMASLLYASFAVFACCWVMFDLAHGLAIGGGVLFMFMVYCCLDYQSAKSPKENFGKFNELTFRTLANASYGIPIGILLGATADYLLSGRLRVGLATLLFPCIFFFILGGHAVLQSYIARILLKCKGRAPLDFHTFIQEGCEKKIFYRVGGGIMFSHRSLMIYFAELKKIPPADH